MELIGRDLSKNIQGHSRKRCGIVILSLCSGVGALIQRNSEVMSILGWFRHRKFVDQGLEDFS